MMRINPSSSSHCAWILIFWPTLRQFSTERSSRTSRKCKKRFSILMTGSSRVSCASNPWPLSDRGADDGLALGVVDVDHGGRPRSLRARAPRPRCPPASTASRMRLARTARSRGSASSSTGRPVNVGQFGLKTAARTEFARAALLGETRRGAAVQERLKDEGNSQAA